MITYTFVKANNVSRNFPPPFHGESTWANNCPAFPSPYAATYAGAVIVINAAPRISAKQMGIYSPRKVIQNTL